MQIWRQAAENVAETLTRGMRVIVSGRLKQRSYETKEGEKRTVFEVEVDEVGPSLRNATAKVTKTTAKAETLVALAHLLNLLMTHGHQQQSVGGGWTSTTS